MFDTNDIEDLCHCNYIDLDSDETFAEFKGNYKLTTMHLNIQSLRSKFTELKNLLLKLEEANVCIHLILLCETYLHDADAPQ